MKRYVATVTTDTKPSAGKAYIVSASSWDVAAARLVRMHVKREGAKHSELRLTIRCLGEVVKP